MQVARGLLPTVVVNQIVPIGDLVVDRAAIVAIGNAAIHAARRLVARALVGQRNDEFIVVAHPVGGGRVFPLLPINFQKARNLPHYALLLTPMVMPLLVSWAFSSSERARAYSTGMIFTNFGRYCAQLSMMALALDDCVYL